MANSSSSLEGVVLKLPFSRDISYVSQVHMNGPISFDVDHSEVQFVHRIVVLTLVVSEHLKHRSQQHSIKEQFLLVTV